MCYSMTAGSTDEMQRRKNKTDERTAQRYKGVYTYLCCAVEHRVSVTLGSAVMFASPCLLCIVCIGTVLMLSEQRDCILAGTCTIKASSSTSKVQGRPRCVDRGLGNTRYHCMYNQPYTSCCRY